MKAIHVHIHDNFEEAKHPRQGGKFAHSAGPGAGGHAALAERHKVAAAHHARMYQILGGHDPKRAEHYRKAAELHTLAHHAHSEAAKGAKMSEHPERAKENAHQATQAAEAHESKHTLEPATTTKGEHSHHSGGHVGGHGSERHGGETVHMQPHGIYRRR